MASVSLHPWWLHQTRLSNGAVRLSQTVTIVRNLEGLPFPMRATAAQRETVAQQLRVALEGLEDFKDECIECPWNAASHRERVLLKSLAGLEQPCDEAVIWYHSKNFIHIVINDGEHIRFHLTSANGALRNTWAALDTLEERLGEKLTYAFDPKSGFATSNPQVAGMGLDAQILLHLPALCFDRQLPKLIKAASEMNLKLEPLRVSDDKAVGHLFLLFNTANSGTDEKSLLAHIEDVAEKIVAEERRARKVMITEHADFTRDSLGRSLGLLGNCGELTFEEGRHLLSIVVMAVDEGILPTQKRALLLRLWCSLGHARLCEFFQESIPSSDEDRVRAAVVKATMAQVLKRPTAAKRKVSRAV